MKTGNPVDDKDDRRRYKKEIMNNAGVRFFEKLSFFARLSMSDCVYQSLS